MSLSAPHEPPASEALAPMLGRGLLRVCGSILAMRWHLESDSLVWHATARSPAGWRVSVAGHTVLQAMAAAAAHQHAVGEVEPPTFTLGDTVLHVRK